MLLLQCDVDRLPIHDEPSSPLSKPPEQEHRKLPIVLLHWPPLQILGFSSHSSTSAHVRLSANRLNPVLCEKKQILVEFLTVDTMTIVHYQQHALARTHVTSRHVYAQRRTTAVIRLALVDV